jgi:fucose permease
MYESGSPTESGAAHRPRAPLAPVSWTLFLALAAYGLTLFVVGPCLTLIAATFDITLGDAGLLFTTFFIGFIGGVIAAGYTAERVGKRRVVAAGLAILTTGLWLLGSSPGPFAPPRLGWALFSMLVVGIGGAATEATASAMVADVNPGREAFAINLMQAFFGFGAVAAPIALAAVLAARWGWQMHFRIAGAVTAALFVALLAQGAQERPAEPLSLREVGQLLADRTLLLLCAAMMLYVGAEIGYTGWVSPLIHKSIGASVPLAAQAVTAFWVTMTVGRLVVSWLVQVVSPRRLMIALAAGGAVANALTGLAPTPGWGIAAAGAVGFFYSGAFGLILTAASDRFTRRRAAAFGLVMTSVGVGGMTLPALMGLAAEATSLRWAMLAPAAAMALVSLLFARRV